MRIAFNTGRLYTELGQRITAEIVKINEYDSVVVFKDHDRMIDGQFPVFNFHTIASATELARMVMRAYDHSQYQHWVKQYPDDADWSKGEPTYTVEYQALRGMKDYDAFAANATIVDKRML